MIYARIYRRLTEHAVLNVAKSSGFCPPSYAYVIERESGLRGILKNGILRYSNRRSFGYSLCEPNARITLDGWLLMPQTMIFP